MIAATDFKRVIAYQNRHPIRNLKTLVVVLGVSNFVMFCTL